MNWYYVDNGQQSGPVTDEQLDELLRSGQITVNTLIWREGMPDWQPYQQAVAPAPSAPPVSSPELPTGPSGVCTECGRMFSLTDMIRHGSVYICANCKPIFLQKLGEGAKIKTGLMEYAGFWIRFAAKFLDGIITNIITFPIGFILGFVAGTAQTPGDAIIVQLMGAGIGILVSLAYSVFFVGKYGATPGKMACKLKIVMADGGRVTYGRATGRFFAEILSGCPTLMIGYIMAGFDEEKRSLHDRICNTRVIYK